MTDHIRPISEPTLTSQTALNMEALAVEQVNRAFEAAFQDVACSGHARAPTIISHARPYCGCTRACHHDHAKSRRQGGVV